MQNSPVSKIGLSREKCLRQNGPSKRDRRQPSHGKPYYARPPPPQRLPQNTQRRTNAQGPTLYKF